MSVKDYLRDHVVVYLFSVVFAVLMVIFLVAYKVYKEAIIVTLILFYAALFSYEVWEYCRKRNFYKRMVVSLEDLDQKYLLPEMITNPSFEEGKIIYNALSECDKSMLEHVSMYRNMNRDFREYIEMWVHEVKLPVASMRLMCHNHPEIDEKMVAELKRVDDYIENVLYYARSENAGKDYVIKRVSLRKIFGSVAMRNRESLQLSGASIEAANLDVDVMSDEKWVEYILGQLMANSLKYAAKERPLVLNVYTELSENHVVLHFKDNGIGIPANDLPYIFEKTFTGENGRKETTKSTGMGLYIVKKMCNHLNIGIQVISSVNEYTEFALTFIRDTLIDEH